MSEMPKVFEGEVEFTIPAASKPCKTWYKIVGDLGTGRPLVVVHGGPGISCDYIDPLADLTPCHAIPVIFYDQIGNARSTHLPEKKGDTSFWTVDLFCDELANLIRYLGVEHDFALYGHSWGGVVAAEFASRQPKGLKRLIIANSWASTDAWVETSKVLQKQLPQDLQDAITRYNENSTKQDTKNAPLNDNDAKKYEQAAQMYASLYTCRINPIPDEFYRSFNWMAKDYTVTGTVWGAGKFLINGTLRTWSMVGRIHKIQAATLLVNGRYDEGGDACLKPFFLELQKVKWYQFADSSHLPHWEERKKFIEVVGNFLLA